ncbi:amidohydrolase [Pseudoroseicyclus aestuarii]|uniref:Cytosine/adenosine deaminase-related metal-dependent hydrolase n=1 Tax=Pseudoroseicyclus aestuarii TaxID=1795041 RepID=A0A318SU10_9RHOB|nr:amidohydrolase [Pseudoroseicyclus aestuarii]PYE85360.1 cytosine/adenosine deaminase-related metal-dependent hydrolase [Pseudoroseicyclus aestuarii]
MSLTLTNARLLTMAGGDLGEIAKGWIRIEGETIAALGEGEPPEGVGERLDMHGDLVMPGLVNPHGHLAMTLFRGLGEEVDDRLFRYILPLERGLMDGEAVRAGTRLALLESIRGGTTTLADMYYFEEAVAEEVETAGLRAVLGQTIADFDAPDHAGIDEGFARADALAAGWAGHPLITPSIAPHAPYSTGLEVMTRVARWSDRTGLPVQMHLAETRPEVDWARREHGATTVEVTRRAGLLRPDLIAAHLMYPTEADMDLLAEAGVGVAHCARANGKAGRGIAPVTALRARGVPVGIATDGAMSGNTLDLFSQFAPATMFQKIAGGSRALLPPREVLRMATLEGAQVLGLEDRIGSLEPGKQADLIRVSLSDPRQQPLYDLAATLVFSTLPGDVVSSMVAGRWLMKDRTVGTLDAADILAGAGAVADRFRARIARIDMGTGAA